jgi:mono/diheme cytochrome c family protein
MPSSFIRLVVISALPLLTAVSIHGAQNTPARSEPALPLDAPGEEIYQAACVACHGSDGTGSPRARVGFTQELPDFADCSFATPEPSADWFAVVHEGGPIRGLDRHMPAFGEALTPVQIGRVVEYVAHFCTDASWPRGDLNLPRPLFTEKAYPENEFVVTTGITTAGPNQIGNDLLYERRLGKRSQLEVVVPLETSHADGAPWTGGIGDVAVSVKRAFYASVQTGRIFSAGSEVIFPSGSESSGRGSGTTVVEPFVTLGQAIGATAFVQLHSGVELPFDTDKSPREVFARGAFGNSFLQDHGFGRAWTPMVELLWARPEGEHSEWDVVPQLQVTLSKLQHVMIAGGVRIPLNGGDERHPAVVTYFLWDWFDGSLFDFWR